LFRTDRRREGSRDIRKRIVMITLRSSDAMADLAGGFQASGDLARLPFWAGAAPA